MPPRRGQPDFNSIAVILQIGFKSCPREGGNYIFFCVFGGYKSFKSCPREGGNPKPRQPPTAPKQFQVMPPRRGQRKRPSTNGEAGQFQVMPPRRGQPDAERIAATDKGFKSCPREGGNLNWLLGLKTEYKFQVMPPRRGQQKRRLQPVNDLRFQVMPPRRGQHISNCRGKCKKKVSSHAPAKGATAMTKAGAACYKFQVMPPRRGQHLGALGYKQNKWVSSHAPAKGATSPSPESHIIGGSFKSCPREGGNRIKHERRN